MIEKKTLFRLEVLLATQELIEKGQTMEEHSIIELYCLVDDFVKRFQEMSSSKKFEYTKQRIRKKVFRTSLSEVLTILLLFHRSDYRTFKHFYLTQVKINLKDLFPQLVGYSRFVQLTSEAFFPMFCFIKEHQGACQGPLFIDFHSIKGLSCQKSLFSQNF